MALAEFTYAPVSDCVGASGAVHHYRIAGRGENKQEEARKSGLQAADECGGECFPYILPVGYCDDENADYGEQGYLFASECADHKYCQRENNAEDLKCYWCFHSVVPFSMIVMIFSVFCRMSLGSVTGKSL